MATGLFNLKQVNQAISQGAWSGYIAPKWVEYLVVAGGGGAGLSGGGGGGGGLLSGIVTIAPNTSYTVTVGGGGAGGTSVGTAGSSGQNSVFGAIASTGGGGGGSFNSGATTGNSGLSGGSGGGGASGYTSINAGTAGQGTANQGNAGNVTGGSIGQPYSGSGGGGSGTIGLSGISNGVSGNGGAGIASSISGTVTAYAGGGAGGAAGSAASPNGIGGVGGGGSAQSTTYGASGYSGSSSLGGGGGGGWGGNGGAGGSGIVVVRYPGSVQFFTGGTLSYANGYMIHTFYSSGTLAPTTPTPYVTDYQISRSLRFNSADSAYLNRTPASAGNRKTWTWSAWVKRSTLGVTQQIFSSRPTASPYALIYFFTSDSLNYAETGLTLTTTQVFRDASAWYHIVIATDTTQATASDRLKFYVNGVQVTSFSTATYPSQNYDTQINTATQHNLSGAQPYGAEYFTGYMTEVNFIDGQALTPSSFGYTNPNTGVWSPLAFVGTYGTNGFYLNFSDNSNTTAATLGKDYSGNGNNWTPNNFSVTAGSGNDSLVDSPTSYGTDTGVGGTVRGNYCTLNPLDKGANISVSDGNLTATVTSTGGIVLSTFGVSSGKWYWEMTRNGGSDCVIGIANASASRTAYLGSDSNGWGYIGSNGNKTNNATSATYGASYASGDVVGVVLDMDAGTVTFYKNGSSQGTAYSGLTGTIFAAFGTGNNTDSVFANFGQRPFAYTAPSGYKALCTQNLPTPAIGATSTTLANLYFDTSLYTGTNATQSITNAGFQPDMVWPKARSIAYAANIIDSVRGSHKVLIPSSTAAEATSSTANGITAFNSNGFTLGLDTDTTGSTNASGQTFVAWQWKANGGTGVTNTAGSITSTVSANTTSGFSVVTYTGNGTQPSTVGHGLGVAPSFVIVKTRNSASYDWNCYHISLGNTQYIALNTTAAASSAVSLWNNTTPTSTVFTVNHVAVNTSSNTYVAYCFAAIAGYSAFGSWTGNGSSDGPFVYCGFRPAYVLIKGTNSNGYIWTVYDSKRNTYNVANLFLEPDSSGAEVSFTTLDFVSNGIKIRSSDSAFNANGSNYIFAAFAENPFKYSLAR